MERTKPSEGKQNKLKPGIISIPRKTMDLLLKQEKPMQTIAVFMFYLTIALRQKKTLIHASDQYCKDYLGIGWKLLAKAKEALKKLKLIEIIRTKKENKDFGDCFVKIIHPEHYLDFGVMLINKRVEDKTENTEASLHDGKPAQPLKPRPLNRGDNILGSSPASDATRSSPSGNDTFTCPINLIFGKDHPDCLIYDCPIEKQCRKEYREKYKPEPPKEGVYTTCPFNHKFGIDTDQFDDCADCEAWDDCIDTKNDHTA